MTSEGENNIKLKDFFGREYNTIKSYINTRIKVSIDTDPEDIIQDVALKLFAGADRYSPINNVAGFVYRSIRNKIIDIMRENRPINNAIDENEDRLLEFAEVFYDAPDNQYSEEIKDHLKYAIQNLKPDYRDIIIAIDFEGYSYKEIALETGIPEGTLMSRRHRAISLLFKELEIKIID